MRDGLRHAAAREEVTIMQHQRLLQQVCAFVALLLLLASEHAAGQSPFSVVMSGLDNPRGLAFGPEGALYVAEAGRGGEGPPCLMLRGRHLCYGPTGAVSRLRSGIQERIATGLPSLAVSDGTEATGPHDVSLHGRGGAYVTVGLGANPQERTALLGEVGAGFGQLVRLPASGQWRNFADIAAYEGEENPAGGTIDSNPYAVLADAAGRTVTDAGGNSLLRVAANGDITTLAVFPSRPTRSTDAVPTSVTIGPDGAYYVGELTGVPFTVGAARVYRVVPGTAPAVFLVGFTAIIDLTFDAAGNLYVLQHATGAMGPNLMGPGALIRVAPDGTRSTVASEGLFRPTSVVIGSDGAIYVSNCGICVGTGEVIRILP